VSSHARSPRGLALLAVFLGACAAEAPSAVAPSASVPPRAVVQQRLEAKLGSDPNHELCEQLARGLAGGDRDAFKPFFDFASFVERVIAKGSLPGPLAAQLRANPSGPAKFGRAYFPDGSMFRCLGTRSFLGEPYIAIRQWTPTRYDYLLVRLDGRRRLPLDDYHVVSSGFLQSELQGLGLDPQRHEAMAKIDAMLGQSYKDDFAGIIASYRTLPPDVQAMPIAFFHFINAVYSSEPTGSALYREATQRMEEVLRGRDYALAYWRREDALRRGDVQLELRARGELLDLLDDYELLTR
jgi:hypothetical protein